MHQILYKTAKQKCVVIVRQIQLAYNEPVREPSAEKLKAHVTNQDDSTCSTDHDQQRSKRNTQRRSTLHKPDRKGEQYHTFIPQNDLTSDGVNFRTGLATYCALRGRRSLMQRLDSKLRCHDKSLWHLQHALASLSMAPLEPNPSHGRCT